MEARVGDILAVRGTKYYSEAICRITNGEVSHVGLVISNDPPLIMEALTRVVTRPLEVSIEEATAAYLIRPRFLDHELGNRLVREACRWSAASYSYFKIVLHILDVVTRSTFFTSNLSRERHPICSFHVAKAYASIGFHFGDIPHGITPQEILTYARKHANLFTITSLI